MVLTGLYVIFLFVVIIAGISLLIWVVWNLIQTSTQMQQIEERHKGLMEENKKLDKLMREAEKGNILSQ